MPSIYYVISQLQELENLLTSWIYQAEEWKSYNSTEPAAPRYRKLKAMMEDAIAEAKAIVREELNNIEHTRRTGRKTD